MKMKKKMEPPKIEIIVFEVMDIIATTSRPNELLSGIIDNKKSVDLGDGKAYSETDITNDPLADQAS